MQSTHIFSILLLITAALSCCIPTPITPAEETASQPNAKALPFSIITDSGLEIDLRGFQYQREYADRGYLIKQQGATTEVYRIEFTTENRGNYTYESRLPDGSVVSKSAGGFRFKNSTVF